MGAPSPLASKGLMPREQRPEHSVAASSTLMGQLWAEPWDGGGGGAVGAQINSYIGDPHWERWVINKVGRVLV